MKLLTIGIIVVVLLCLFIGCSGMYLDNTLLEGNNEPPPPVLQETCTNDGSGSYKSKIVSMNYKINVLNKWLKKLNNNF